MSELIAVINVKVKIKGRLSCRIFGWQTKFQVMIVNSAVKKIFTLIITLASLISVQLTRDILSQMP